MPVICSPDEGAALCKTVLNVGCGYPLRQKLHRQFHGPEWREIRLDLDPAVQPDVVCSITDTGPVTDDSVDAVWSSHNLEHLQRHEVPKRCSPAARNSFGSAFSRCIRASCPASETGTISASTTTV